MDMGNALRWLEKGFQDEFGSILKSHPDVNDALVVLVDDEAEEIGRRAARAALAPLLWRALARDVFDTSQVAELLDVSRQALNKRVRHRSLLALPARRTTYFPTWQFDFDRRIVRPVIKDLLVAFHDALDELDPFVIVSWSRSPQPELDGMTPQEWIQKSGSDDRLKLSAKRAASSLAA